MALYLIQNGVNKRSGISWVDKGCSGTPSIDWNQSSYLQAGVSSPFSGGYATLITGWNTKIDASGYAHLYIEGYFSGFDTAYFSVGSFSGSYTGSIQKNGSNTNATYKFDLSSLSSILSNLQTFMYAQQYWRYFGTTYGYIKNLWLTKDFTLSYNANGGSGAPSSTTAEEGTTVTVSSTKPSRSNSSAGSYRVTFDANGGSCSTSYLDAARTTSYTFSKWNTKADGTGTDVNSGGSYTLNAATTLYAKWNSTTTTASVTLPTPTRTGYTFKGWATSKTATSGSAAGASYTPTAAVTLYAIWQAITYTISFNVNGGSGSIASQTKTYGVALTLTTSKPTKSSTTPSPASYTVTLNANGGSVSPASLTANRTTSYSFSTWNTAANGTGTSYASGGSYTANAAATLYAQYNSSTSTAAVTLPTPTRSGYQFLGWATSSTAASGTTGSYTPTGNVTLYAIWKGLGSVYASYSSSVQTNANFSASVTAYSSAYYQKIVFKKDNASGTTLATSSAFQSSLNYTVPRSWFASYSTVTSLTVCAILYTYTDSSCTTQIGNTATATFTVTCDAGMKPAFSTGALTLAAYNTGTGIMNLSNTALYVKGFSKVQATFDTSKITLGSGATIDSYSISVDGVTTTSTGANNKVFNSSNTLTTSGTLTVSYSVTDSRGLTTSSSTTISVNGYSNPTLTINDCYRSTSAKVEDEEGTYFTVKATATRTAISNNAVTITVAYMQAGGSYGTATTLTSGTASVIGSNTISADKTYTVRFIATDTVGTSVTLTKNMPARVWPLHMIKDGVAFGEAATQHKAVKLKSDWSATGWTINDSLGSGSLYDFVRDTSNAVGVHTLDCQNATDVPLVGTVGVCLAFKPLANGNYSIAFVFKNGILYMSEQLAPTATAFTWKPVYDNHTIFQPVSSSESNVDANNYTATGIYMLGIGLSHAPAEWISLVVMSRHANLIQQLAFGSGQIWYRERRNNAWSDWNQVYPAKTVLTEIYNSYVTNTDFEEASCDWGSYSTLCIAPRFYNNVYAGVTVPKSYFQTTTSGSRIILFNPTDTTHRFEIYQGTASNKIYVKTTKNTDYWGIKIWGIT